VKVPSKGRIHLVIGDTQVKDGVPTAHLSWIGQYIVDQFAGQNLQVCHLGDHADMPSLSSYDKGKRAMEGRRYRKDVVAANNGFDLLNEPLHDYNKKRRVKWEPDLDLFLGNHENRITVACENDATLDGALSLDDLNYAKWGWRVHPFLKPVWRDGIAYSHYFYNRDSGKPQGGEIPNRLKNIGHSFTMGHQQGLKIANREVGAGRQWGLVLGSTYLHRENYRGPQATNEWRGIVVCHQVERGSYDPMCVSLDWLCRKYEKKTLKAYLRNWK
jgi:hypothetical protein